MNKLFFTLPILLTLILCNSVHSQGLNYEWGVNYGSTGSDNESISDIFVDSDGFSYTVGSFAGTIDLDPGAGTATSTSSGAQDPYILKLDSNGDFVWAKTLHGLNNALAIGVFVDSLGNVYACGGFQGTVDFDPGPGVTELIDGGMFVLKLDANGDFQWVKHLSGNSYSYAWRIEGYQSHLIVAGSFQGTVDFDPNAGVHEETSAGSNDVFVLSLDFDGNFEWVRRMGGGSQDVTEDLSVHSDGRIAVTGWFRNTADFDPGVGTSNLTSASSNIDDIFVVSLTSTGDFEWARGFGSSEYDNGNGVDFDDEGNVYVTGFFEGSCDFDPGAGTHTLTGNGDWDVFVVKLSSQGNFEWAHSFGQTDKDLAYGLAVDNDNNVYVTGYFEETVDWDPSAATNELTSSSQDLFLLKLDSQGNYNSVVALTGLSSQHGQCIFTDEYNGIWVGGKFRNTVDLMGDVVETGILSPVGTQDNCLLYFSQCDIDTSVNQTGYLLTANETAGAYQWYDCDNQTIISGQNSASFLPSDNGNYAVIISQVSCVDTSSCYTISGLSIDEQELLQLSVYPNPADEYLIYTLPKGEAVSRISVWDMKGQEVKVAQQTTKVDIGDLDSGVYILLIESEERNYQVRFSKR